jgi:ferrous iron transport protein B
MVWLFNKGVVRGKPLPFLLELPPYQAPKWRDVILAMYFRGKVFLKTAGTVIIVLSVVVWALLYFPRSANADAQYRTDYAARYDGAAGAPSIEGYLKERQIADSYLGRFGKTIEPAFKPAGFDWRLSTAILAAFPAREVLVSSLGIIFSLGGDVDEQSGDLRSSLQNAQNPDGSKLMTPWTAVGLMVFFALCAQCMATLATVRRETNSWKWPIFMFVYMTTLAYLGAVAIHQISKLF